MFSVSRAQKGAAFATVLLASASLAACSTIPAPKLSTRLPGAGDPGGGSLPSGAGGRYKVGLPYQVAGIWYTPKEEPNYDQTGTASWYGDDFHMKPTANGEIFDMHAVSAAHTTLPMPSIVEVTNLDNGRKIQVRVNDRGPFVGNRLIDLSHEAARQLGYDQKGLAHVRVKYVGPATLGGPDTGLRYAKATPAPGPVQPAPLAPVTVQAQDLPPAPVAPVAVAPSYRIQAGAFASQDNAQKVATQLQANGAASIEPFQRADGVMLYRVLLAGPADEGEAFALRDRLAASGFGQARVLRPF